MSKKHLISCAVAVVIFLGVATYVSLASNDTQLFSNADKNSDGVLDKNEFMSYIKSTQHEKQKKSSQKGVRICPRTGEICEDNCSGDGTCCMEGGAGEAKAGCCKEKNGEAKAAGCCKENNGEAKAGCCKEKNGEAKAAGCCKENNGEAKAGCCKENNGEAKAGCCKENELNNNETKVEGAAISSSLDSDQTPLANETKSVDENSVPVTE